MLRNKVPEITLLFWVTKILTTGMGETLSDFLVGHVDPVGAVLATAVLFAAAIVAQFTVRRYVPWLYWLVVVLVGVLGTMIADFTHVVAGVPYLVSTSVFLVFLVAVFVTWRVVEGTVDVHAIDTRRREAFYWAAVVATFALGTAAGDLVASRFHLGYLLGGAVFVAAMCVPIALYLGRALAAVPAFWVAYVLTRPVGASFADWGAVSSARGGLGFGTGPISAVLAVLIVVCVAVLSVRQSRRADLDTREWPADSLAP
ncbi:hypothetical protein DEI93_13390 [Curtobacterium sp. MCBD17_035]|uniref:COG4705 family protein n=1 Tax=Curtobacterium sp. MCBD17_035 TaxID=2175673 RepID=UPI0021AC6D5C|nr:hypothetical protein [Curtobacterium sp. MCBD17_035]WIB66940.1 hypothetical protein DEI93_13390 [Curtobacterium sp. MCBD17_035]